ncbi:hypothetical protein [Frankia sp. Cj5]|uniref:hypothetical protein n=1 Tax=Frankia sp. Cj5 TaxID=2880978 RepID=UPI001EF5D16F|nr:hypothetical protein [Frankia sp. Cj5]
MKIYQAHRSLREVDEKPPERSPGVSGDSFGHAADPWLPAMDDPLFGPLHGLPPSIRRPTWTPDAGAALPGLDEPGPSDADAGDAEPIPVESAVASPPDDRAEAAPAESSPPAESVTATDGIAPAAPDHARHEPAAVPPAVPPVTRGYLVRLITMASAVAALVIASVTVVAQHDSRDNSQHAARMTAPSPEAVGPAVIDSGRTDADPITANEFFNTESSTFDLRSYQRLAYRLESGCPGLTGELTTALSGDRCRQLVHAVYLGGPDASGRRVLGAVSVLAVDETSTAQNAANMVIAGRGSITALAVPPEALPGALVTNPTGDNSWRTAPVSGHYLIVLQLAYTDGSQGASSDPALSAARRDLAILASEPISRRTLTGHGPR